MRVVELKALARERGLRGYSRLRKAELIALLRDNLQPLRAPAPRTRPPRPTRGPRPPALWKAPAPPPPQAQRAPQAEAPSVRFRPDRPRQPELTLPAPRPPLKRDTKFKPYQLKPKRGTNVVPTIVKPPTELLPGPKKLKRMKKKLDELNRKIRHSKKRHNRLIHKQNSLRKSIEALSVAPNQSPCQSLTGLLWSVSKLTMGLTGVIGLMEDPRWTLIHSSVE